MWFRTIRLVAQRILNVRHSSNGAIFLSVLSNVNLIFSTFSTWFTLAFGFFDDNNFWVKDLTLQILSQVQQVDVFVILFYSLVLLPFINQKQNIKIICSANRAPILAFIPKKNWVVVK